MTSPHRKRRKKTSSGKVTVLQCRFHAPIRAEELHRFKGALQFHANANRTLLEALGCDLALLHGHDDNDPDWRDAQELSPHRAIDHAAKPKALNWLPLVYYRMEQEHPVVVGVGPAARVLELLLLSLGATLPVGGRPVPVHDRSVEHRVYPMGPAEQPQEYHVQRYAFVKAEDPPRNGNDPRTQRSYSAYKALRSEAERIRFIEGKLLSHLLELYEEIGEDPGPGIRVEVLDSGPDREEDAVDRHKPGVVRDLHFRTNAYLPPGGSLGIGTRMGYGRIVTLEEP